MTKLTATLKYCLNAFAYALLFSCIVNILTLTVPIYMLQMFDRVLPSQSSDTLIYLSVIAILAVLVLGILDIVRAYILTRVSSWLDNELSPQALGKSLDHTLLGGNYAAQSLVDITTIRQFLSSPSIYAFFDAPWVIIFLAVIYMLYIPLGILATIGAIILFCLALVNEMVSRTPLQLANNFYIKNQESITTSISNAESIQAMGMLDNIAKKWLEDNSQVLKLQSEASDKSSTILGISKFIRMSLQVLILAMGAYYVILGELTSGAMIAASIIMGRALAPVEQAIGAWKQALGALHAAKRLQKYLSQDLPRKYSINLPKPKGDIKLENVLYIPQGSKKPVLSGINMHLLPGQQLGIIGPSGSGKSTLARLLVGIWQPTNGSVRLDEAEIYNWPHQDIGNYLGYLPQNAKLFPGTVRENISRMGMLEEEKVLAAAKFVGAHEMILHLKNGFETNTSSYNLSGGQCQRILLARAFYKNPKFVVLDEPESNLDEAGLTSIVQTIKRARENKITLAVVTQRPSLVKDCDFLMVLRDGKITYLGPYNGLKGK